MKHFDFLNHALTDLQTKNRFREFQTITATSGAFIYLENKKLINFGSNNYLGLAQNFQVKLASIINTWRFGSGSGASRLISGNTIIHEALEHAIASLKGSETALVYPTGYMANLGAISTLIGQDDVVILDHLNHASIVDACLLSKAKIWVYPHKDVQRLDEVLENTKKRNFRRKWVITESLFSMDGDIAPLPEILKICENHQALLMIDEAHATGVLGENGRGALEYFGIDPKKVPIMMGTLSKALGSLGGFIAGEKELIDYLRNRSKTFIYTTGLPTSVCSGALKAIQLITKSNQWVEKLKANIDYFYNGLKKAGIDCPKDKTPIIPIITEIEINTMKASQKLKEEGFFVPGIRPPTVPEGEGRLRISLMATHTKEQLDGVLEAINNFKIGSTIDY